MSHQADRSETGSALIAVMFVVIAMAGMSAALLTTSLYRQSAARSVVERERAGERAMAGLDVAVFELREGIDTGSDGIGNASGSIGGGTYTTNVDPAFSGPGTYTLEAVGRYGPERSELSLVIGWEGGAPFGLFGRDGIDMSGNYSVDSFDASKGTYASQFGVDHAGDEGHIGSNGDIKAGGGSIWGDATPGPGAQVLGDPSNVMGSTAPATEPVSFEPYVYSPPIPSSGSYSGSGTISAGTYRYDDLTLGGSDLLAIDGNVTLYVDGKFTSSGGSKITLLPGARLIVHHGASDFTVSGGGVVNLDQQPDRVRVYSASVKKITLSGGSDFFGLVYAPETEFVASGGSDLFGVVVTRYAKLSGGGRLHFDTSLSVSGGGGNGKMRVIAGWR